MLTCRTWGVVGFVLSVGFVACSNSDTTSGGGGVDGGDASVDERKMMTDGANSADRASPPSDGKATDGPSTGDASGGGTDAPAATMMSVTDAPPGDAGATGDRRCPMGQPRCTSGCVDP